jgi:hypothetical protein
MTSHVVTYWTDSENIWFHSFPRLKTEVRYRHYSSKDDLGTAALKTIRSKKWRFLPLPRIQQTEESVCVQGACFERERASPDRSEKKHERERFDNQDITPVFGNHNEHLLIAGDFNCVMDKKDCTGHPTPSRAPRQRYTKWISNPCTCVTTLTT